MTALAVAAFGAIGALARWFVGSTFVESGFPVGTLAVNLAGSFAIGGLAAGLAGSAEWLRIGLTVGLLGAFTTFSTFSLETVRLVESGRVLTAVTYVLVSVCGGFALAYAGLSLRS